MSNFSLISNLNTIGKIFERLAIRRHSDHSLNLEHLQSAYRALHSTETVMTKVVSDLLSAVDGGEPSALLSLDISAAFDTLDHHRLLSREHELFGFFDLALKWMQSYFRIASTASPWVYSARHSLRTSLVSLKAQC